MPAKKRKTPKAKRIKVRVWSVLITGGNMGWTVDRFYDEEAANQVARLLQKLSARRFFGKKGDVVVQPLETCEHITPEEYATRVASGAKFEVVE